MYSRVSGLVVVTLVAVFAAFGCGSSKGSNNAAACTPMARSTPHAAGDPCPQTSPNCPAAQGYVAVSTCQTNGTWSLMCDCVLASTLGTAGNGALAGTGGTGAGRCGDGVIQAPEQCDGANIGTASCANMVGGTGVVTCTPTCTLNMSMCVAANASGAGGAGH